MEDWEERYHKSRYTLLGRIRAEEAYLPSHFGQEYTPTVGVRRVKFRKFIKDGACHFERLEDFLSILRPTASQASQ